MKDILERCVELDTAAQETYVQLAAVCTDSGLRHTFERMGTEEWSHVDWWTELRDAFVSLYNAKHAGRDRSGAAIDVSVPAD